MDTEPRLERTLSFSRGAGRGREVGARAKVIVADDQPAMRRLVAQQLRAQGYDVVEVSDGGSLWREFETPGERSPAAADLIVSDVRMPECSGLSVLELIRERSWALPVILMTAFGDQEVHEEAARLGAICLDKPFVLSDLIAHARRLADPR